MIGKKIQTVVLQLKGKLLFLVVRGHRKDDRPFRHPCPEAGFDAWRYKWLWLVGAVVLLIFSDKCTFTFIIIYDAVYTVRKLYTAVFWDALSQWV